MPNEGNAAHGAGVVLACLGFIVVALGSITETRLAHAHGSRQGTRTPWRTPRHSTSRSFHRTGDPEAFCVSAE